jgi:hypothetical protein
MSPSWYGLDGQPISMDEASRLFSSPERSVARTLITTEFGRVEISTVFLVLDHSFVDGDVPVLWESMIFGGPDDLAARRYRSRAEAVAGHAAMVAQCRAALAAEGVAVLGQEHGGDPAALPG